MADESDHCDHCTDMGAEQIADISDAWERHAQDWIAWARTPDHDTYYWLLNLPACARLVPPAGRLTLDIGCGEGRVGRWLADAGHRVWGIDSSPTLTANAVEADGYEKVVCGSATELPWPDGCADLAVAFMSLHDMPDPAMAITEVARVLEPGGVLCVAIVHPLNRPAEGLQEYVTASRFCGSVTRRGLTMTFEGIDRPLESYTRALAATRFVIDELREPRADAMAVAQAPELEAAAHQPFFLHLRCRRA
ncbi:MAG: class I SAM-dependent methyltransferase [Solirubrobacteraceae bacterium]